MAAIVNNENNPGGPQRGLSGLMESLGYSS